MRLNLNSKKKSKHNLPSLDFVTALSIEECRARLLLSEPQGDNARWSRFDIVDEQHFTIDQPIVAPYEGPSLRPTRPTYIEASVGSIQYQGSLTSVSNGTHIQAVPIQEVPIWPQILIFAVLPVVIVFLLLATISNDFLVLLVIVLFIIGGYGIAVRQQTGDTDIRTRIAAKEITDWLYDTLYEPPETRDSSDQVKQQA